MKLLHMINGYYKQIRCFVDMKQIKNLLVNNDFAPASNNSIEKIDTIAFFCEAMYSYAGGSTSLLRLAKYLSERRYQIFFVICSSQTERQFRKNALSNLDAFEYQVVNYSNYKGNETTLCIATAWQTVYFVKRIKGYKLYFVQDYEPYFYDYGEKYFLSKKTYELGFHIVSLGGWNLVRIEKESHPCGKIESIDFPIEQSEYGYKERSFDEYKYKKKLSIAVYIKDDGKRLPVILQIVLKGLQDELQRNLGINLDVLWFGWSKHRKVMLGHNLGRLSKQELEELYQKVDFGMVASMTNISLVPLEMIACGLPVIEFEEGSFTSFFTSNCAILTDFNYKKLYVNIVGMLENPKKLEDMVHRAHQQVSRLSWKKTCEQFENIIEGISKAK